MLQYSLRDDQALREAPIKSDGDAASAMPKSVLLNRVCAMQTHQAESLQEPLNSALISGSLGCKISSSLKREG